MKSLAALLETKQRAVVLPSPHELLQGGLRLKEVLEGDPQGGQNALRKLFGGQPLVMRPQPDRTYVAEGRYFPMVPLLASMQSHKGETPQNRGSGAWYTVGCAGRI